MTLRPAAAQDIDAIMRIERLPGYEVWISSWTRAQHEARLTAPDEAMMVWDVAGAVRGVAILQKLDHPTTVQLRTIAIDAPGEGLGRPFVRAVIEHVFTTTPAHRLELDTSAENPRARHVYETLGFVHEGRVRDVYRLDDGRFVSSDLFSMLRPEWAARRA
jgi:ribosomal protein S18 acetylase RimI-like enzyme